MIDRLLYNKTIEFQGIFPVVAILGPRQCGKSTLARMIIAPTEDSYPFNQRIHISTLPDFLDEIEDW